MDYQSSVFKIKQLRRKLSTNIWRRNDSDDWEAAIDDEGCVQGCAMVPYVFGFATLPSYIIAADSLKDKKLIPFLEPIRTIL